MMTVFRKFALGAVACTGLLSCMTKGDAPAAEDPQGGNGVYYWRTMLQLDSVERRFLQVNDVKRGYVRFFDIVVDKSPMAMDPVMPNATLQVKDSMPVDEVIPTVFITVDAMKEMQALESMWAEKIVKRICNMCSYNGLPSPREVQLDCDWTGQTNSAFFNLCREVKKELLKVNPKGKVSSTIRLHQLSQTPPPVDYGVLMVYNTGSFSNPNEYNSILTEASVKPYMKYLADYRLDLVYALPIFKWELAFHDDKFQGILRSGVNLDNEQLAIPMGNNRYRLTQDTIIGSTRLRPGDVIRKEMVTPATITAVKRMIERERGDKDISVILYSLDSENISNYTEDEIKQIY
ncbi:MAG: hypothetical protein K2O78_01200 [Muribaculaceae bacterium]|nr:hypothetical protein [Muribaculaceae bacterium]